MKWASLGSSAEQDQPFLRSSDLPMPNHCSSPPMSIYLALPLFPVLGWVLGEFAGSKAISSWSF